MADELSKQILDKLNSMDSRFDSMDKRISNFEKELSDFRADTNKHFDTLEKKLDRHDEKLDAVYAQVAKNSEDITQIKADQHALVAGQQKQDKILEALAMRSLEQETDIKDLKRIK